MDTFGERLRELRNEIGLKQKELGDRFKLSESAIGMYERDEREPSFQLAKKIAKFFDVSLDYLLGESDIRNPYDNSPDFATSKDKRDFKKFLEQQEVMFDGVPVSKEAKDKVLGFMESMFWDAKQKNKRKKKDEE